mmetsp:Transcript_59188/g.105189  ORF Transcript_59188/g.105189 Transcript_59188/m.105189 type:complete len:387 (+) Transcript_59188:67-1227(+)|eukprot:CAMPEP_0197621308 /NCGR_PEP_ID=MMETSP1338-20131121/1914_1 /TAXON_ID=43686 ORGANISM="Pelagodinium beii, Strain RCC1491" /NCGR_SAMPLE_ID=MMETSP1338 /ASSEMBLY_ACC=CAM_ASM_000754 /LENGTH=386 /DNA_ID=CAMNT_0043190731 /DNA_START=67 /DNA_END=1227 /DNA_ORIENTATION=-
MTAVTLALMEQVGRPLDIWLPPEVVTPVSRRRRPCGPSTPLLGIGCEDGEEESPSIMAWMSPARRRAMPASPTKAARCVLPGAEVAFDLGTPSVRRLPSLEGLDTYNMQTPEPKSKVNAFSPPPAPCTEQQQRQIEEDVKTALTWDSVPLLSLSLLRGARMCSCRSRFDHSLHEAVNQQQLAAVRFLLTRGMTEFINEPCSGSLPLSRAIHFTHKEGDVGYQIAALLLQHGARTDTCASVCGNTALHEAASEASLAAVCLLLHHGADSNVENFAGRTPLHLACGRTFFGQGGAQRRVVEELLKHGGDPTRKDKSGKRPLDHAADAACVLSLVAGNTDSSLGFEEQLIRAERWWARRPVMLLRHKGPREHLVCKMPDSMFQAVVRFL